MIFWITIGISFLALFFLGLIKDIPLYQLIKPEEKSKSFQIFLFFYFIFSFLPVVQSLVFQFLIFIRAIDGKHYSEWSLWENTKFIFGMALSTALFIFARKYLHKWFYEMIEDDNWS